MEVVYTDGKAAKTQLTIKAKRTENDSSETEQQEDENAASGMPETADKDEAASADTKLPKTGQEERTGSWLTVIVIIVSGGTSTLFYLKKKRSS